MSYSLLFCRRRFHAVVRCELWKFRDHLDRHAPAIGEDYKTLQVAAFHVGDLCPATIEAIERNERPGPCQLLLERLLLCKPIALEQRECERHHCRGRENATSIHSVFLPWVFARKQALTREARGLR